MSEVRRTPEPLVGYVSFGPNLQEQQFLAYIQGGTPHGSSTHHVGSRNPTRPRATRAIILNHALSFEGWATYGAAHLVL